ncbi:glycoside hydrolase family 55 protein [Vitiosangium sp. GDMCC 1.1324]|uniref:glycoside hydrolase family 55 protein n=1 Tax=Vitiosangium sp. (strain GDMCC 1.1324) TaxID=2138576 RepID=UPI001E4B82A3|nr:glycoside hydrolase family 55 protein [Vitiosangium sp. GDMCC 1.1324]
MMLVWLQGDVPVAQPVYVDDHRYANDSDDTAAFQRAFDTGTKEIRLLARTYVVSAPVTLKTKTALHGEGSGVTTLRSSAPQSPVILIEQGADFVHISGMTIEHDGPSAPVAGGDGIFHDTNGITGSWDRGVLTDLRLSKNYIGFNVGMTAYTMLFEVQAVDNVSHGFNMVASALGAANPLQYYFSKCSASKNGGCGYRYESRNTAPATSVGALENCITYANGSHGVAAYGVQTNPLASIRIDGGFYGEDRGHGIYLDTWGSQHLIRPGFVELANECGIYISDHNREVQVSCGMVVNNGLDGLFINCPDANVTGGQFIANGRLRIDGRRNGVYYYSSGTGVVTGVRSKDVSAANQQSFGLVSNAEVLVTGSDLRGNMLAGITGLTHPASTGNRT